MMAVHFDDETIAKFRRMSPREAFELAKDATYRHGAVTSSDFEEVFEALVREGVLTWSEIEKYQR